MISALMSAVFGLGASLVPDILKEVKASREADREERFLRLQHELQMARLEKSAGNRLEEAEANVAAEELRAFASNIKHIVQAQHQPTGIKWLDAFNSFCRPFTSLVFVFLIVYVTLGFSHVIPQETFAPLFIDGAAAVLGYLFGYRPGRKKPVQ